MPDLDASTPVWLPAQTTTDIPAFRGLGSKSPAQRETEIARSAGYAAGWASGAQSARAAVKLEHEQTMARLTERFDRERLALQQATRALLTATARVETSLRPDFSCVEDAVLDSALELATAILGHEVAASTTPGLDAIARVLNLSPPNQPVRIRLNPADAATVADLEQAAQVPEHVEIVADPEIAPGDAVAIHPQGSVECRMKEALSRIQEVLGR